MITEPYRAQIEAGDVDFFMEKDYTEDVDWVNKNHWCVPIYYKGEN